MKAAIRLVVSVGVAGVVAGAVALQLNKRVLPGREPAAAVADQAAAASARQGRPLPRFAATPVSPRPFQSVGPQLAALRETARSMPLPESFDWAELDRLERFAESLPSRGLGEGAVLELRARVIDFATVFVERSLPDETLPSFRTALAAATPQPDQKERP